MAKLSVIPREELPAAFASASSFEEFLRRAETPDPKPIRTRRDRVLVGPDEAVRMLEDNTFNRPIKAIDVRKYARDIQLGKWVYNPGDTAICFDWFGRCINGQHRLWAIVESGIPIEVDIVENEDPAMFAEYDKGRRRTGADLLGAVHRPSSRTLAAMARLHLRHEYALTRTPYRLVSGGHEPAPSPTDLFECVERNPDLEECVNAIVALVPRRLLGPGAAGWILFRLRRCDREKADEFWGLFGEGAGLNDGDPIFALRRFLLNRLGQGGSSVTQTEVEIACAFKAWNAWLAGLPIKNLSWRPASNEPFPTPATPTGDE